MISIKRINTGLLAILLTLTTAILPFTSAEAARRVRGYTRRDGTYVRPYRRSRADGSKLNNYSSKGNYNPYTGKMGSKDPYTGYNKND